MRFSSIQVTNFKAFEDSGPIQLSNGFNVLVGKNNAGKTSLLQALTLKVESSPHKNPQKKSRPTQSLNPTSRVAFDMVLSGNELSDALLASRSNFFIPVPLVQTQDENTGRKFLDDLLGREELTLRLVYFHTRVDNTTTSRLVPQLLPSHQLYSPADKNLAAQFSVSADLSGFKFANFTTGNYEDQEFGAIAGNIFRSQIYTFSPERYALGECKFGKRNVLLADASNLPEVLNVMQSIRPRFDEFNRFVRLVFPEIFEVTVRPKPDQDGTLEILVWMFDPKDQRDDLAMTLRDCGTGVGQVLALLYVALTSRTSRTILIDEPNSFLHPGAAKKIIEILRQYSHLQFIISTHSPEILRVARPEHIITLKWATHGTSVEVMGRLGFQEQQSLLAELGTGLGDIFGADYVLWVEGITERECFPLVIEEMLKNPPLGLQISAIKEVSDFEGTRLSPKLVTEVYRKLTEGATMMPKALAFSFDRELRTEREIAELESQSGGLVHFLPRRMYENYLLEPAAIAAVMNISLGEHSISQQAVSDWFLKQGNDKKYFRRGEQKDLGDSKWRVDVHGANILRDLFDTLSSARLEYRKVQHGVALTRWLLTQKRESLSELAKYLGKLTSQAQKMH